MKKILTLGTSLVALCALAFAKPYTIDHNHSSVSFKVKHLGISKVSGTFDEFDGKLDIDPATKKINVLEGSVQTASIDTKNVKRDKHLNDPDFFNTTKQPKATFVMTKQEGGKIYGNLTILGITKPVVWDVEVSGPATNPMNKKEFMALEIKGKINRKDFKIGSGFGDMTISDTAMVNIQLEVYAQ